MRFDSLLFTEHTFHNAHFMDLTNGNSLLGASSLNQLVVEIRHTSEIQGNHDKTHCELCDPHLHVYSWHNFCSYWYNPSYCDHQRTFHSLAFSELNSLQQNVQTSDSWNIVWHFSCHRSCTNLYPLPICYSFYSTRLERPDWLLQTLGTDLCYFSKALCFIANTPPPLLPPPQRRGAWFYAIGWRK